jgi:SH3-like domain-containing protein
MHKWFASTACPGPYLEGKFSYIAEQVNKKLGVATTTTTTTTTTSTTSSSTVPRKVRITASVLNIRSGPGTTYKATGQIKDKGVYTITDESNGWGKLKSGAGWISLAYTKNV